jgi:TLC domain
VLFYFVPNVAAYKMPPKTELDFRNRIVSFFHGLSALVLTSYQVFFVPYSCGDAVS